MAKKKVNLIFKRKYMQENRSMNSYYKLLTVTPETSPKWIYEDGRYYSLNDNSYEICECWLSTDDFEKALKNDFLDLKQKYSGYYTYISYTTSNIQNKVEDEETIKKCDRLFAGKTEPKIKTMTTNNSRIEQLYESLRAAIIGQDQPIKELITVICKNEILKQMGFGRDYCVRNKQNIMICGPSGTGKTETLTILSELLDIPMIIVPATQYTEQGYWGSSVEDLLHSLYVKAGKDQEKMENGIIAIDEIDKIAKRDNSGQSSSDAAVQEDLLHLLEGREIITSPDVIRSEYSRRKYDTSHITFIGLGAFEGIEKLRTTKKRLMPEDFERYGLIPEFVRRFRRFIGFNPLTKEDITKILTTSTISPLTDQKLFYEGLGMELVYDEDYIEYAVRQAMLDGQGASSLKRIIEESLEDDTYSALAGKVKKISMKKTRQ